MLLSFFYIGEAFLRLFGLTISSFAVAGSFVIFLVSMEMLLDINIFKSRQDMNQDTTFMPVVFPTLIGAGVLPHCSACGRNIRILKYCALFLLML